MRKPKISKFREDDGTVDHEAFDETMGDYEDAERDRELEERNERTEEKERHADYSDQEKRND